jgi:hypothetical protein
MGKRRATPGTKQLGLELAESLAGELRRFAAGRSETMRQVVEQALRRHMDNPPPIPKLPPLSPVAPPKTRRRKP